jgi:hypothetical protein
MNTTPSIVRRWRFRIEGHNDPGGYIDADGQRDEDCEYIGTDAHARAEADRRADAWERATGDLCAKVTYESRGVVSPEESRAVYQAGYRHQRRGGFCIDAPYPLGSWQYQAWLQGYDHAAYKERHGLTHLHLHLP